MTTHTLSRRAFLHLSGVGVGTLTLAACATQRVAPTPSTSSGQAAGPVVVPTAVAEEVEEEPHAIVGDVLDFGLKGDWPGRFGFVKFRLHPAFFNGDKAYFIRTDASDQKYAEAEKLVWAPKLSVAVSKPDATANLYVFDGGAQDQLPVLSTAPSQDNYNPLWHVHRVKPKDPSTTYDSVEKIEAAEKAGEVTIEQENILVNFPVAKWPGGELSVDKDKKEYLGTGQLLEPVDIANMTVTFKLHECFPGSRYIVTDTSAAPMAPMMAVAASSPTQQLVSDTGDATDKIWVFANGIAGSGVMGFQPAIFAHRAGEAVWSPFWNHFTLRWKDGVTPRVLKSEAGVRAALDAGQIEQFNGTPDTHPTGFVVNCPVPVLAPNTFTG